jgi:hypothetical protein
MARAAPACERCQRHVSRPTRLVAPALTIAPAAAARPAGSHPEALAGNAPYEFHMFCIRPGVLSWVDPPGQRRGV